jgi:NTE family protein
MYKIAFIIIFFVLGIAQMATATERKKVAVVLSGGGTKGMAHIGVLKALEEHNIPIDYIAGTSIGAIIGSMYAAGYAPDEIEELVLSDEFERASVGRIDDTYRQFYLESAADPSWINLYFGWEDRFEAQNIIRQNIPGNIVSPYLMDFLFMEYLGPASAAANYHFDNLFIPFRCIATEIESRSAITMRDGSLADAVRASMTFPFYFKPIEIDGRLMMDGGMFNNFPADVVHLEFQPDVVIGSVVSDNPAPPQRDDILSQLQNLLMHPSRYDILTDQGVLIRPDVPDIAVNDMSRNAELVEEGYIATLSHMTAIKNFIDDFEDPVNRELKRIAFRNSIPDRIVGDIQINGLKTNQKKLVLEALGYKSLPMDFDHLKRNYFSLLLNHRFDYAYPYIQIDHKTGFFIVNLEMEKENELLRSFGGNISSRSVNHIFARFEYSCWSNTPLTLSSSVHLGNFYNSIAASARLDFPGDAPLYLKTSTLYSSWQFSRSSIILFEEQSPPFLSQREFITNFTFGYPLENDKKVEIGGSYCTARDDFFNSRNFSETDTMDQSRFNPFIVFTSLEKSSLNRKQFPTRGSYFYFEFRLIRGNEVYTPGTTAWSLNHTTQKRSWAEVLFQYRNFFRPRSRFNPGFSAELFLSHKPLFSNYTASMAMARQYNPFPLATTLYMPRFRANNYAAAGLKTIYSLSESTSIQSEVHLFQPFQTIGQDVAKSSIYNSYKFDPKLMANLAFVYHTAPGPLSISMSYFHKEQENWVFMINFGFILFNKQAFM